MVTAGAAGVQNLAGYYTRETRPSAPLGVIMCQQSVNTQTASGMLFHLRRRRWFTRSRALWEGCTQLPCNYEVPKAVRLVYCLEMGHYLQVRA